MMPDLSAAIARRLSPTPQYLGRATTPDASIASRITHSRSDGRPIGASSSRWIKIATFTESTMT